MAKKIPAYSNDELPDPLEVWPTFRDVDGAVVQAYRMMGSFRVAGKAACEDGWLVMADGGLRAVGAADFEQTYELA